VVRLEFVGRWFSSEGVAVTVQYIHVSGHCVFYINYNQLDYSFNLFVYSNRRKSQSVSELPSSHHSSSQEIPSLPEHHQEDREISNENYPSQASVGRVGSSEQVGPRQRRTHGPPLTTHSRNGTSGRVTDQFVIDPMPSGVHQQPFFQVSTSSVIQPGEQLLPGTAVAAPSAVSASSGGDCAVELEDESAGRHMVAAALNETNPSMRQSYCVPNIPNIVYPSNPNAFIAHSQGGQHLVPVLFVPQSNMCLYPMQSTQPRATGEDPR